MAKKIFLLLALVLNIAFAKDAVFADELYAKNFYIDSIETKINLNWIIPADAEGKSTVVSFTVNPNKTVSNIKILRSSGSDKYDQSAISAIYKSIPFEHSVNYNKPINIEFFFSPVFTSATDVMNSNQTKIVNVANRNAYIDFSEYTNDLQEKINTNWNPSTSEAKKAAIANIQIGKDGALENYYILKSSKNKDFDRDVLDAISKSVPLAPFPAGINAPKTDVQVAFTCNKVKMEDDSVFYNHFVNANVMNIKGYDHYTKQVERIIESSLEGRRYFFQKDLLVEFSINKTGKLKYVKIKNSSGDKNFDRKILAILQKTSFPPVPETIPFDTVTLNYEILTQRGTSFSSFVFDYLIFGGTTKLKSFAIYN